MGIDLKRRQAVMSRSRKLGHCVCNPRQPCPCEDLVLRNLCPCAGEKPPPREGDVPLTLYVRKAGCASKIGQADLLRVLENLPPTRDPRVLVGTAAGDDAGVYELDPDHLLVHTVDVFTPCVDDAYLFGQIAAANSVSDVYAMGGKPLSALSILGFPVDELDGAVMEALLRGGVEKMAEAGCPVIGGHSMNDEEVKCGFAVTGLVERKNLLERDRAQAGDELVLTKPLGTGMVAFAAQLGRVKKECLDEVGAWMASLNKDAAELMVRHGARACTDVTGYGLAGHLVTMARGSGLAVRVDLARIPAFQAVEECLRADILPGAVDRNEAYSVAWVRPLTAAAARFLPLLYDPQTSGGLLVAFPPGKAGGFVHELRERGNEAAAVIGRFLPPGKDTPPGTLLLEGERLERLVGSRDVILPPNQALKPPPVGRGGAGKEEKEGAEEEAGAEPLECCPGGPPAFDGEGAEPGEEPAPGALEKESKEEATQVEESKKKEVPGAGPSPGAVEGKFMDFMGAANQGGLVSAETKKLVALALAIANHCEPCLRSHLKSALAMGFTKEELDEVANLATAFGGCTAQMFYKDVCRKLGI